MVTILVVLGPIVMWCVGTRNFKLANHRTISFLHYPLGLDPSIVPRRVGYRLQSCFIAGVDYKTFTQIVRISQHSVDIVLLGELLY